MSLRLSICDCGHEDGLPARSHAVALSPPGSFAVSRSIVIGLPAVVFLLPTHRMSDELVKTARADRSSVKPFQFIPIPFRPRIGCRMMCSLAACPLRHVPPSSCLLVAVSSVPLIRLVPRPAVRVVPRFSVRLPISSCCLALSCLLIGHIRLVSSAHLILPALASLIRLALLILPVPRVGGRGVPRLALISSCVPPTVMCVLLTALRSAHLRGVITDVIASPLRSAATVPPPTLLALSPRLFVSGGGEMSSGEVGSDAIFFLCGIFARSGDFPGVRVL